MSSPQNLSRAQQEQQKLQEAKKIIEEQRAKGLEPKGTIKFRTVNQTGETQIRAKFIESQASRKSRERAAISEAKTEAEFAGFRAAEAAGARQGIDVTSARVRTDIQGDSVKAQVDRTKGIDTVKIGSMTRQEAAKQILNAPRNLSVKVENGSDLTRGASDFPTLTPVRGIRGRAGVSEGFTEYGKYTRVAKKEPITGQGYVAAGFEPERAFFTEVTVNAKKAPFVSRGKELVSDFVPGYGGTPFDSGRIGKSDFLSEGGEKDPRTFIDAEARNLAVVGQEIVRGNPTFDPYKKFQADLTETQRGGATFKPEITPVGSLFEFASGSAVDLFTGKGFNGERLSTLRTELTENPARTLGGALGAVPFFVTPIPVKNPAPFITKGLGNLRLNIAERSLLGDAYSGSKGAKIRPTTIKDNFLGIKESFRQAEKAEVSAFTAKATSPRSIESQITKDIQDINKGLGFREVRGRNGLITLQRVEQVQKQIEKQIVKQQPLPKTITRQRQRQGTLGATLGLGDSNVQVSRILNKRRQKDEFALMSLATPDNFTGSKLLERFVGQSTRQSQLIDNMAAFRTDVRQRTRFDTQFSQMFKQAQLPRQTFKQEFALRTGQLARFDFAQQFDQRQSQLEKMMTKMLTVQEFKIPTKTRDIPLPFGFGGEYGDRRRKRKGKKDKYFKKIFSTADAIRASGFTKEQSKIFQARYGRF